jgi:hypothetical protein
MLEDEYPPEFLPKASRKKKAVDKREETPSMVAVRQKTRRDRSTATGSALERAEARAPEPRPAEPAEPEPQPRLRPITIDTAKRFAKARARRLAAPKPSRAPESSEAPLEAIGAYVAPTQARPSRAPAREPERRERSEPPPKVARVVDPYNPPPETRVANARPGETQIVEFDRSSFSPEINEMLSHLRPSTTTSGAAKELTFLRSLTKPSVAAQYLELYENFPNRVIRRLSGPQAISDQMRRLLDDYKEGKLTRDISEAELRAPPTPAPAPATPAPERGRTKSPSAPARGRSEGVRMDSPDDSTLQRDLEQVMEDVDPQDLPVVLRDSGQERNAVEVVQMKRNFNNVVETGDTEAARRLLDNHIQKLQDLKEQAKVISERAPADKRTEADAAFEWFNELADQYVKDLRKRAKGEPTTIRMHKKESSVARAIKDRSTSRDVGPASSSGRPASSRRSPPRPIANE